VFGPVDVDSRELGHHWVQVVLERSDVIDLVVTGHEVEYELAVPNVPLDERDAVPVDPVFSRPSSWRRQVTASPFRSSCATR